MNVDELRAELSAERIRPAYLLAGAEALLRDDALAALEAAVLLGGSRDFDLDRLAGENATPAALRDAVGALPMTARRRLVVLREPEAGRGKQPLAEVVAEIVAALVATGESAEDGSTVLVVAAAKCDKRSRWVKAFRDPAAVVECAPPRAGRALAAFVRAEAKRQEVALDKGAADLLAERVGPQLLQLRQEIAKASLLAGPGEKVGRAEVAASTGQLAEEPIWDLTDAIGEGRRADAVGMLGRMLAGGAPGPVVLGSLASHFRKLSRARAGASVPGPPFVVKKLERQARRYAPERLSACLDAIHGADLALKGAGTMRPEMALERLVLGLAS